MSDPTSPEESEHEAIFRITSQSATALCRKSYTTKDTDLPGQPLNNVVGEGSYTVSWEGTEPDELMVIIAANARIACARAMGWEYTVTDGVVEIHTPVRRSPAPQVPQVPQIPMPQVPRPPVPPAPSQGFGGSAPGFSGGQRAANWPKPVAERLWADWAANHTEYETDFQYTHPWIKPTMAALDRLGIDPSHDQKGQIARLYAKSAPDWAKATLAGMGVVIS